eukprot:6938629-Prymnesium_polylepis.1
MARSAWRAARGAQRWRAAPFRFLLRFAPTPSSNFVIDFSASRQPPTLQLLALRAMPSTRSHGPHTPAHTRRAAIAPRAPCPPLPLLSARCVPMPSPALHMSPVRPTTCRARSARDPPTQSRNMVRASRHVSGGRRASRHMSSKSASRHESSRNVPELPR